MRLKNSRKRPDKFSVKYFILLLIVCVFFSGCDPIVKEGVPKRETFSLAKLFEEIRKADTASKILSFKPDTGHFKFNAELLNDFYPDPLPGLKDNVVAMSVNRQSPGERGKMEETEVVEYLFENGRPVKKVEKTPYDTSIQTFEYNAAGLLSEHKFIYPGGNDSVTREYQYDNQNRLVKILYFDGLNVLVETAHFFYNKAGNLDSVFDDDSEGESFSIKYFTNNTANAYLWVKIRENGKIVRAYYYTLEDNGQLSTEEHYDKDGRRSIYMTTYDYNSFGELTSLKTENKTLYVRYKYDHSYKKRDAAGSWIEMIRYLDGDLHEVQRRTIKYK
jgi:hypothetical protein